MTNRSDKKEDLRVPAGEAGPLNFLLHTIKRQAILKAEKEENTKSLKELSMRKIILASASPRRRELLEQIGAVFEVCPAKGEEKTARTEPGEAAEELSLKKCREVFREQKGDVTVIGADTLVVLDGKILGKPGSEEEAVRMLSVLRGRTHQVFTGVTVMSRKGEAVQTLTFHESTQVSFYPMSDREIRDYVLSGEPMDKAGAYGIQGKGAVFVREIRGDYNNVVGLPAARLYQELKNMGIRIGE